MLKQKISIIVVCDDCGLRRKEQVNSSNKVFEVVDRLRHDGWLIHNERAELEPCWCPTCSEVRNLG